MLQAAARRELTLKALADRTAGLLLIGFDGTAMTDAPAHFIAGAAGAILFRRNIASSGQSTALVGELQAVARAAGCPPLLIAVDQEGGTVERLGEAGTAPPSAMALGAADDAQLTRSIYRMVADELRALGMNVDLAPVADVLSDATSPLGLRTFGSDPKSVARHVVAAVEGLHDGGVAAAAKHFPGLGRAAVDSHEALPSVDRGLDDLRACELAPFRAAIGAGVDIVMSGHLAVPRLDASGDPATLSRAVLTGLLRDELGFGGVVCTDDLEMQAVAARLPLPDAAVRAVAAGADLVLFSRSLDAARAAHAALRDAVLAGILDPAAVEASLERIARLRARVGESVVTRQNDAVPRAKLEDIRAEHLALVREAAHRAIAIIRTSDGAVPLALAPGARVFIANFTDGGAKDGSAARVHSPIGKALAAVGAHVTEQLRELEPAGHEFKQLLMAAGSADVLVAVTRRAFRHRLQAQAVTDLAMFGKPLIVIAALEPFDAAVVPEHAAVIASFGDGDAQLEAAADVLLGKRTATGRVPVDLARAAGAAGAS
jgi:beta-N-acetylhexosaminidase